MLSSVCCSRAIRWAKAFAEGVIKWCKDKYFNGFDWWGVKSFSRRTHFVRPTIRMNVKKTSSIKYEQCHSSLFDNTLPWIHTMAQLYKDTLKLQCAWFSWGKSTFMWMPLQCHPINQNPYPQNYAFWSSFFFGIFFPSSSPSVDWMPVPLPTSFFPPYLILLPGG